MGLSDKYLRAQNKTSVQREPKRMLAVAALAAFAASVATPHPCLRHPGVWAAPPKHTPTTSQISVPDGPFAGNGMVRGCAVDVYAW